MSLEVVRCPSCLAPVGLAKSSKSMAVLCNEYCADDYRLRLNEDRDALIELLSDLGYSAGEIAFHLDYEVTRQAIGDVLERRFGG